MSELGLTIRALREGLNLSQEELGRRLGVSRAAVSAWEGGVNAPRGKRLQKVADAFGITVSELMAGKPKAPGRAAGTVIAVQSNGTEIPLVDLKSCEPALWSKTRQRVIVVEEKSGRKFGILATDETIESLTKCLAILRELL